MLPTRLESPADTVAADLVGRATGNMAAMNSWAKSLKYFDGRMERER
jgi:hypothetical protein